MSTLLDTLQDLVADRLVDTLPAEDGLHALQITSEHKGSIDARIQERIRQACAGVVVGTGRLTAGELHNELVVTIVIGITVNVITNFGQTGTRRTAAQIAEHIYAGLQNWSPSESWTPLEFVSHDIVEADADSSILFYASEFTTSTITSPTE